MAIKLKTILCSYLQWKIFYYKYSSITVTCVYFHDNEKSNLYVIFLLVEIALHFYLIYYLRILRISILGKFVLILTNLVRAQSLVQILSVNAQGIAPGTVLP